MWLLHSAGDSLNMVAGFQAGLSTERSTKEPDRYYWAFSGLASEIILYFFCHPLLVKESKSHSDLRGEDETLTCSARRVSEFAFICKIAALHIINGPDNENVGWSKE